MVVTNAAQKPSSCCPPGAAVKRRTWLSLKMKPSQQKANDHPACSDRKLQSPHCRRRYQRRGSKTLRMLRLPADFHDSIHHMEETNQNSSGAFSLGTASTVSMSSDFSLACLPTRCDDDPFARSTPPLCCHPETDTYTLSESGNLCPGEENENDALPDLTSAFAAANLEVKPDSKPS